MLWSLLSSPEHIIIPNYVSSFPLLMCVCDSILAWTFRLSHLTPTPLEAHVISHLMDAKGNLKGEKKWEKKGKTKKKEKRGIMQMLRDIDLRH